jgi:hypothetical protein
MPPDAISHCAHCRPQPGNGRLQGFAEQLPRRTRYPGHVPRRGGGIALSHLPGLPLVTGIAMGIGAMCVVICTLPMTSVLLATLLLASDGLTVMPLVIAAVVVAHLGRGLPG